MFYYGKKKNKLSEVDIEGQISELQLK